MQILPKICGSYVLFDRLSNRVFSRIRVSWNGKARAPVVFNDAVIGVVIFSGGFPERQETVFGGVGPDPSLWIHRLEK